MYAAPRVRAVDPRHPWPEAPAEPLAEVPEIETVRDVLRAVRSERTRTGLCQGRPLPELVVDADDAETRAQLEAMTQSLAAAARARTIRFGPATTETSLPGVRIDIVPEPKPDCLNACGRAGRLCSLTRWTSTTRPEEAAWRAEFRAWLEEQRARR